MKNAERYAVYSISQCVKNTVKKNLWLRLGSAMPNSDGSFSLCLGALPLPDRRTGFINLYMRKLMPQNSPQANDDHIEGSINVELDPVFGIPLEAR